MFARAVSIKLRDEGDSELTRILGQEVVSRFQQERDFLGLLAFILTDGTEALSISLWEQGMSPGAAFPADLSALTTLAGVVRGTPSVQVYWVSHSTLDNMKNMLGQEEGVEAFPDLEIYQSCFKVIPIIARTVHAELWFPGMVVSNQSNAQGHPYL